MHKLVKRILIGGPVGLAIATAQVAGGAVAQDFPNKRITLIVGYNAGGFTDSASRVVADQMSKVLGQTVVVENRGGASSTIAALAVSQAKPDGYTILASTASLTVNETLFKKLEYSLLNDLVPVAVVLRAPETFDVPKNGPDTLKEFIEKAKQQKLNYAIPGQGTTSAFTYFTFFKDLAKVDVDQVPFRGGGPAMQAVIGGQTHGFAASASGSVVKQVNAGNLKCLAVAAPQRDPRLPNCPTLAEAGYPNHYGYSWVAFWVPKGTPADVVAKLNQAINSIAQNKAAAAKLEAGGTVLNLTPKEADDWVKDEVKTWGERVKTAGAAGSVE
jgi:tripartite-type tricarboxylate transporter receptor subunit TctC